MTTRRFKSCKRRVYTTRLSRDVFSIAQQGERNVEQAVWFLCRINPRGAGTVLKTECRQKAMGFVSSVLRQMAG